MHYISIVSKETLTVLSLQRDSAKKRKKKEIRCERIREVREARPQGNIVAIKKRDFPTSSPPAPPPGLPGELIASEL